MGNTNHAFQLLFTSLSIILLAFFIYLNSLAKPDREREQRVMGSLAKEFVHGPRLDLLHSLDPSNTNSSPETELDLEFSQMSFSERYSSIAQVAEGGNLALERKTDHFLISLPGQELFRDGDDQIRAPFLPVLTKLATELKEQKLEIQIEGHSSENSIGSRRFKSSWELSIARASSVMRFFLDRDIPQTQLSASGRGSFEPVARYRSQAGYSKNDRIILTIRKTVKAAI